MQYLLATTNKAKVKRYGTNLAENGIDIVTLNDLNMELDVDENGKNPIENAIIKAKAYNKVTKMITIAIDDALFLDNVPDEIQPGTHVRRFAGRRLNDEEMVEHYISLVNQYGTNGNLIGYFRKAVAIVSENEVFTFEHKSGRTFTNKQSNVINEGYPLSSIQIVKELGKFKSELTKEEEEQIVKIEQNEICNFIIDTIKRIENQRESL